MKLMKTYSTFFPREIMLSSRVNRLGEFSHIGRLFNLGSLLENYRDRPNCVLIFPLYVHNSYALILTQKPLGYILGIFFSNSSGHPDFKQQSVVTCHTLANLVATGQFTFDCKQGDKVFPSFFAERRKKCLADTKDLMAATCRTNANPSGCRSHSYDF
jgi:hypothetical protein